MGQWKKGRTKTTSLENSRDSSKIVRMDFGASNPELMPGARNGSVGVWIEDNLVALDSTERYPLSPVFYLQPWATQITKA